MTSTEPIQTIRGDLSNFQVTYSLEFTLFTETDITLRNDDLDSDGKRLLSKLARIRKSPQSIRAGVLGINLQTSSHSLDMHEAVNSGYRALLYRQDPLPWRVYYSGAGLDGDFDGAQARALAIDTSSNVWGITAKSSGEAFEHARAKWSTRQVDIPLVNIALPPSIALLALFLISSFGMGFVAMNLHRACEFRDNEREEPWVLLDSLQTEPLASEARFPIYRMALAIIIVFSGLFYALAAIIPILIGLMCGYEFLTGDGLSPFRWTNLVIIPGLIGIVDIVICCFVVDRFFRLKSKPPSVLQDNHP